MTDAPEAGDAVAEARIAVIMHPVLQEGALREQMHGPVDALIEAVVLRERERARALVAALDMVRGSPLLADARDIANTALAVYLDEEQS
jgi:hypothetical protein